MNGPTQPQRPDAKLSNVSPGNTSVAKSTPAKSASVAKSTPATVIPQPVAKNFRVERRIRGHFSTFREFEDIDTAVLYAMVSLTFPRLRGEIKFRWNSELDLVISHGSELFHVFPIGNYTLRNDL